MAVDVLVTGGAGVLGRRVVEDLRGAGHRVVSCGRVLRNGVDASWDVYSQDGPSPDCDPEVVVHAAAKMGGYQQPLAEGPQLFDVNVLGTLRVTRWCASRRVRKLVLISSAIVYGAWDKSPKSETELVNPWVAGPYAVSKWCGEQIAPLAEGAGVKLSILRLSSLYGPDYPQGLIPRLLETGRKTGCIAVEPPFDDAFDLLNVRDAAKTVRKAVEHAASGLFNAGSSQLTTLAELAATCAQQTKADLSLVDGVSPRQPRIINWVDDRKARSELGHESSISLANGIAETNSGFLS